MSSHQEESANSGLNQQVPSPEETEAINQNINTFLENLSPEKFEAETGWSIGEVLDSAYIKLENGSFITFSVVEVILKDKTSGEVKKRKLLMYNHPQASGKIKPTADLAGKQATKTKASLDKFLSSGKYESATSIANLLELTDLSGMTLEAQNASREFAKTVKKAIRIVPSILLSVGSSVAASTLRSRLEKDSVVATVKEAIKEYKEYLIEESKLKES